MPKISAEVWGRQAACAGISWTESDEIFFPTSENPEAVARARESFCDRCPLLTDCLNDALDSDKPGLWAGTSTDSRRKLRRTRHRVKCPLCQAREVIGVQEATGYDSELCLACGVSWASDARPPEQDPKEPAKPGAVAHDARTGRVLSTPKKPEAQPAKPAPRIARTPRTGLVMGVAA
jgi:hypothetical protein